MRQDKGRIKTSNPKANKLIDEMTEKEYKEWSKPYTQIFEEEFPVLDELKENAE